MRTIIVTRHHSFGWASAGAVLLLAWTAAGQNLFVANWYSPGAIYEITPGGSQSTFHSGGLGEPEGLAFDTAGNLLVADSLNGAIDKFTPGGTGTTFAFGLGDINSLAFDHAGNLFAAGYANGTIYEFTPGGSQSTFASGLNKPGGLAFDAGGDLFASDASGNIYEYTPDGARSTFVSGVVAPFALAFNGAGNLFVGYGGAGTGSGGVAEFTPARVESSIATGLYDPNYLAFDKAGDLFVADDGSGDLIEITSNGTKSTFATGLGMRLDWPYKVKRCRYLSPRAGRCLRWEGWWCSVFAARRGAMGIEYFHFSLGRMAPPTKSAGTPLCFGRDYGTILYPAV